MANSSWSAEATEQPFRVRIDASAGAAQGGRPKLRHVHDAVTVHMEAPPKSVWSLVSDVTQIGRFSPETFEAKWVDGATGPAVGARFRGHVKRNGWGPVYWTLCEVVTCEPGSEFAFDVLTGGKPLNRWGYRLAANGEGTDVTESFTLAPTPLLRFYWAVLGWARGKTNVNGMRQTLERIKAVVEADAAGSRSAD
jgi:hypothetical protein